MRLFFVMNRTAEQESSRLIPIWLRIVMAISTISVVIYYSIVPPPGSSAISRGPLGILRFSYWLHLISYTGLTIIVGYTTAHVPRPDWQLWVFVIVVGIGVLIELIQYTIPARSFSLLDILVNLVGVLIGIVLLTIFDNFV